VVGCDLGFDVAAVGSRFNGISDTIGEADEIGSDVADFTGFGVGCNVTATGIRLVGASETMG
jgi:hypothetical protein